ncbi:hypothetical protein HNR42_002535 [Deinobacterium chartae]|uniref:DUF4384 domain-containing protein n=1 Tax=Deinobacterium chartae TaxID=521158 RepID=A0A841I468_9DEIO|nr:DUF4384 domain-containing protein [Deinobacterium chartae]MBB6099099.1 hypothetical protein [Deinobacterium chartae]
MKKTLLLAAATLATAQAAELRISPQSIVVNPVQTDLQVDVWTDRDPSGARTPEYHPGERVRLYARVNQDAYVYLFSVNSEGAVSLILPNRYQGGANLLRAGSTRVFPEQGAPYTFDIARPYGVSKILAVASKHPLDLNDIARFRDGQNTGFAEVTVKSQAGLAQALSIVVQPIAQNEWVSDTAYYTVVGSEVAPVRPTPLPTTPPAPRPQPAASMLQLSVPLRAYPGLQVLELKNQGHKSRVVFRANTSLNALYQHFDTELVHAGFRRSELRLDRDEARAEYHRGGERLELKLREKKGRFELELSDKGRGRGKR